MEELQRKVLWSLIDGRLLYKIKNSEDSFRQPEINEEPTKKGYTDIFFFGRSGSKSCVFEII